MEKLSGKDQGVKQPSLGRSQPRTRGGGGGAARNVPPPELRPRLQPPRLPGRGGIGFPLSLGGVGPDRGLRGEEEGDGVKSGPGEARTILLLHITSARPSKQPRMVRTFLKGYMELGSSFVSVRTNKRHHHPPNARLAGVVSFNHFNGGYPDFNFAHTRVVPWHLHRIVCLPIPVDV